MERQQLEHLLTYQNEDVISRFTDQYDITEEEAMDIFDETKKFLYLCQLPGIFIPDELLIIDEMWHNFILFTKEYHNFCNKYLGRYFHHLPASKVEKQKQQEINMTDPSKAKNDFDAKLAMLIGSTFEQLGADTAVKWFKLYPVKYSKAAISSLRKY